MAQKQGVCWTGSWNLDLNFIKVNLDLVTCIDLAGRVNACICLTQSQTDSHDWLPTTWCIKSTNNLVSAKIIISFVSKLVNYICSWLTCNYFVRSHFYCTSLSTYMFHYCFLDGTWKIIPNRVGLEKIHGTTDTWQATLTILSF